MARSAISTPEKLARLVANAAVRYAVRVADASSAAGWASAAMSTLFIGADSGSMTVADSIRSIVRGVLEANRRLRATKLWERVRIDRLQFVELFEDMAEQAAHVINSLPDMLAQELTRAEGVKAIPQLGVMPGGEYSRPPEDHRAQGWWRRVQVSGKTSARRPPAARHLELVYTPLTDRAKLSQSTAVQSLPQVARLVEASMLQSTVDLKLSNALFELLLPASLKHSIRNGGDVLLLLNSAAARYPFELMADWESMAEPVPLIKKCGILRQLELREQPRKIDITTGRDILVIGLLVAPAWPTLPGAREEAHRIADLCRDRGYRPTLLVNATSRAVQTEVFASDARVLHIAAHGQYLRQSLRERRGHRRQRVLHDRQRGGDAARAGVRVPELLPSREARAGHETGNGFPGPGGEPRRRLHERGRARGHRGRLDGGRCCRAEIRANVLRRVPRRRALRRGRPRGPSGDARAISRHEHLGRVPVLRQPRVPAAEHGLIGASAILETAGVARQADREAAQPRRAGGRRPRLGTDGPGPGVRHTEGRFSPPTADTTARRWPPSPVSRRSSSSSRMRLPCIARP